MIDLNITGERTLQNGARLKHHDGPTVTSSQHGRTFCELTCPYCEANCETTLWALAGSGKRCPDCFAWIGWTYAMRPTVKDLKRLTKADLRRLAWEALT